MLEKEQRILERDSEDVSGRVHHLPEMKLSTAVRKGIAQGRSREMRKRKLLYGIGAIAATAAAILITVSSLGVAPKEKQYDLVQTTSIPQPADLESFRPIAKYDQGIAAALDKGIVKPINQSVERKGFRIDIAGAFTDGRKAYIMYSATNNTDHTGYSLIDFLEFGGVEASSIRAESKHAMGSNALMPGQTGYYVYTANLVPSAPYKEGATIGVKIWDATSGNYRDQFKFTLPLEPNLFKNEERIYHPGSTLIVDGQKINVRQVQFTPLNAYVDLEYDKSNDKQIFKLLNPVLIGKSGDETKKVYYPDTMFSDDTKVTLVFKTNEFDRLDRTDLKIAGMAALDKNKMKIVVDLNKKQIIEAPDTHIQIIEPDNPAGAGEILFHFKLEKAQAAESFGMWLEDSFTDANGVKHKRLSPENIKQGGHLVSTADDYTEDYNAYNFGKEALNYPQPLTIGVKKYWNPIMESQSVELVTNQPNK
ncbi:MULTISPECIES: DUF4179 domain-containing protein [Paenibacillus]|uniref:DUF4179 domain-containing protein n=1 Tax=Paenibacillus albilobatus TaxID=2716884 RepID=A0A919XEK2_9BACL|nr:MULTISPECIES: DUF4179 domain-containing protein [Paenibacillus]GIO29028.1 hypothetical protein J2TS6_01690 [Paenibacillus albilobatus]